MRGIPVATLLVALFTVPTVWAADPPAGDAAGKTITIRGPMVSAFHFKGQKLDGELVVYAFDGPVEVKATLNDVLDKCVVKVGDLDADHWLELQKQMDEKLRYFVETKDPKIKTAKGYVCDYPAWLVSVTGTLEVRNGKKWLVNTQITPENKASDVYPPAALLKPNKPFVMPKEQAIDLKITDTLSLKCVPIPPGTFIMGTPFYQWPRYQDECPSKVTLTKTVYMSEIPITQEMWEAVMGKDKNVSDNIGPQLPVELAPMPDIRQFLKILSEKNVRTVRLPTAAEMEYAARVGTSNIEFPQKNADAWVLLGSPPKWSDKAQPVKTKKPNEWGLYDMYTEAVYAVSDWKAYNTPEDKVDPQGAKLEDSISAKSVRTPKKPVENMIMNGKLPAIHKAVMGGGRKARAGSHDRYTEDGLDGINGADWIGIFRIVVEAGPPAAKNPDGTQQK
jgi:formylglycine-generating enzyme required for sulfatase activity